MLRGFSELLRIWALFKMDKKIVNIRLDPELWKRVKSQAALEDQTLERYVTQILQAALEQNSKPS